MQKKEKIGNEEQERQKKKTLRLGRELFNTVFIILSFVYCILFTFGEILKHHKVAKKGVDLNDAHVI